MSAGLSARVFTTYRDTQSYLAEHITEPWTVSLFHGQLKPAEKDEAVTRFREATGPQILVSTEAGGEGRNLQFCHMLVNYDLPWNPMKVEQRIGRVQRLSSAHRHVVILNLVAAGTAEEAVVGRLAEKLQTVAASIATKHKRPAVPLNSSYHL